MSKQFVKWNVMHVYVKLCIGIHILMRLCYRGSTVSKTVIVNPKEALLLATNSFRSSLNTIRCTNHHQQYIVHCSATCCSFHLLQIYHDVLRSSCYVYDCDIFAVFNIFYNTIQKEFKMTTYFIHFSVRKL